MSFVKDGMQYGRGAVFNSATSENFATHSYKSETDDFTEITSPDYFPAFLGATRDVVIPGDRLTIQDSTLDSRNYIVTFPDPVTLVIDPAENPFDQSLNTTDSVTFSGIKITPIVLTTSTTLDVNKHYIVNGNSFLNLLLPSSCSVGDIIQLSGIGGGLFSINQTLVK